jgi:hypothetical protein
MKNLRRFAVLATVFFIAFTATAYASHSTKTVRKNTPAFYGNVYVFYDDAPLLWGVMQMQVQDGYYEVQAKKAALINKGEVISIKITIPYNHSEIRVLYKGHIYSFWLKPHLLGYNFIMFTFAGDG